MIIYKALNKVNGKIYIGQTIRSLDFRIEEHLRKKSHFSNALKKYGLQSFEFSVIDSTLLKEIANEKEKYWIKFFDCKYPKGYNLTAGGRGNLGHKHTEETRKKISNTKLGKKLPPRSNESRRKYSESKMGINNPFYGKPLSQEHKNKVSEALKGRIISPEARRKISKAHKGKVLSAETRKKISEAYKSRMLLKGK